MGGAEDSVKILLGALVLFILYQVPGLQTPLRWIVGLIILGLLVRYYRPVSDDIKAAFNTK